MSSVATVTTQTAGILGLSVGDATAIVGSLVAGLTFLFAERRDRANRFSQLEFTRHEELRNLFSEFLGLSNQRGLEEAVLKGLLTLFADEKTKDRKAEIDKRIYDQKDKIAATTVRRGALIFKIHALTEMSFHKDISDQLIGALLSTTKSDVEKSAYCSKYLLLELRRISAGTKPQVKPEI